MEIVISKKSMKFLKKQTLADQERLLVAIRALPAGDVKKLQGRKGWRLRVGDYRVLFDQYGNIIDIFHINNRGDVYK